MDNISSTYRRLGYNLTGLHAFYAVAQSGSFTTAAGQLAISQSAISQRIKLLEQELGVVLFVREHRGVTLTNDGLRLLSSVGPAMQRMGSSVSNLLEQKNKPRVRISADFAFSTLWLLPKLQLLIAELDEEVEIQLLASQIPPEVNGDDCDIGIHVRAISDIRDGDVLLLPERVVAVCSPEFLDRNGPIADAKALLNHQLLSLSRPPSAEWQTWQGWFDALNISGERTHNYVSFNNYDMVTQSAVAGQGIALGWVGLIDGLLENGSLVQLTDHVVGSRSGYVMSEYRGRTSKGAGRVFDWIISQMGTV